MPIQTFSIEDFFSINDQLAAVDDGLAMIIRDHDYPPMWQRPNTFETFIHFILEQQVSLASALAALNKLRERLKLISVDNILTLTDEEMRACYVSRQKTGYIRGMAQAIADGTLDLASLEKMEDAEVKSKLVELKGIGNWTAEVYMMFVLQRADIFPVGDIAAVNALKHLKKIEGKPGADEILKHTENWKPHRTIATMILWHYYLENKLGSKKSKSSQSIRK